MDEFIERRIATGLIVSSDYLKRVRSFWRPDLLESPELVRVADWCIDYFDRYAQAPDQDIEAIYMERLKEGVLPKADAELIEEILSRLSDEYGRGGQFNSGYLYDQTVRYLRHRELQRHNEQVQDLLERGRTEEATVLQQEFKPSGFAVAKGLELGSEDATERIKQAFDSGSQPILRYPGALGQMLNEHFVRGGFVAFLAPEKRGKTWLLMDAGFRCIRQKGNVAFFQAGDMTEGQFLRRLGIYLTKRSDRERYCEAHWRPVGDCVLNQLDLCDRKDRNCDHGIFEGVSFDEYFKDRAAYDSYDVLVEAAGDFPDYRPCDSAPCKERKGAVWLIKEPERQPLTGDVAASTHQQFFRQYRRRFKLATYPSGTLTVSEIKSCLDEWERADDFVPDLIITDYADLMDARISEFRHRQDAIWRGLRGLSQERHCLVITATQSDAASYSKGRLSLSNFSEDKRKHAHVTAMWGMNQDPGGREKRLGILRINELLAREGTFDSDNEVRVLQDLRIGRPFLESF